jgi:ABC-type nitrate/sulfonate/bicarbonate transport system substrate-binding protein
MGYVVVGVIIVLSSIVIGQVVSSPRMVEIVFGYTPSVTIATLPVVAVRRGLDRQENLIMQLREYATSPVQAEAIAAGDVDIGGIGDTTLVALQASGVRVKFVAQLVDVSRAVELICRVDRGVREPKDLEGKVVGYTFGGLAHNLVARFFAEYGVDERKVRQVDAGPAGLVAAYARGDLDCIALWPPGLLQAKARVPSVRLHNGRWSFLPGREGPRKLMGSHSSVFATDRALRSQREALERVLRTLLRALRFVNTRRVEAADDVAAQLKVSRREVLEAFTLMEFKLSLDEEFYRDVYDTWMFFYRLGRLKTPPPPGLVGWVDDSILRGVDPSLVRRR